MTHKPHTTEAGTVVPACLAHELDAAGFITGADVDCPLCLNPRKARRYAGDFAKRHTGGRVAPIASLTECGGVLVVR